MVDVEYILRQRVADPDAIVRAACARSRAGLDTEDGRLLLIAADHPARGSLGVGDRPSAMANREDLLQRMQAALSRPGVDGVLGTADVIEDLLLLDALEHKVVVGSMNRGGLAGSVFELDDRFTGYDAPTLQAMGFDGGKMLTRIDLDDAATVRTLERSSQAVSALADHGLMAMVEPFLSRHVEGRVQNILTPDAVIKSIAIGAGLGTTSRRTWLKLPVVDEMDRVMRATTLPAVLLGGDPAHAPAKTYARWEKALALHGVRGLVVGRALLYPPDDDVAAAVDVAAELVHSGPGRQKMSDGGART